MEAALAEIQGWAAELDAVVTRIAPRFPRREVRRRVRGFLRGLLGPVEREVAWTALQSLLPGTKVLTL